MMEGEKVVNGVDARVFPTPPLQAPGSRDCAFYATAYICRLLGHDVDWTDVREWRKSANKVEESYPMYALGIEPTWKMWGNPPGSEGWLIAFSIRDGYKDWILQHIRNGEVASAHTFLVPNLGHVVALVDANDEGVLLADSCRGLVWDTWEQFIHPVGWHEPDENGRNGNVSRIEFWWKLPNSPTRATE